MRQKRLPGRAKWCPTAALYELGLMPQNNTRKSGAMMSDMVLFIAARISSFVGL
ncbi:hypothetical protein H6G89_01810 [Oscillatoria sp. FACHB-1407]|uniref:hypothetical protein n=1 Tax=Oscillatoria sp. FACHB-1407 TaxID=2692847 RepID=UPI00168940DF|nr:hypothetical protein [Oscillatoria sp. FACHB-1407]MBD2459768.1 hypothetical protein [Oscillatoria sp. FACHB-1407]